jgi:hypothetical protein
MASGHSSGDLPFVAKAAVVAGVAVLIFLVINVQSGGELWRLVFESSSSANSTPTYGGPQSVEDDEPSDAEIRDAMATSWSCFYDPTINDNWHDDVRCTNGVESHRPILLEGQFVTEADMTAAAAVYEAELNAHAPDRPSWVSDEGDPCADGEDDWRDVLYECTPPG